MPGNKFSHRDGLDNSFSESFKAFFQSRATDLRPPLHPGMVVDWQPTYRVFWRNLRDLISPPKLPPLKLTSKPVPVRPLWAKRRNSAWRRRFRLACTRCSLC